ncbi:MAG: diguanylate cyclase [Actinomycetota bacterium]|nr:diguanylate cyclase [Actinomycetota bacterium]
MHHNPSDPERRAIEALAHIADVVYSLQTVPTLRIEYLSPAAVELLGSAGAEGGVDLDQVLGHLAEADRDLVLAVPAGDDGNAHDIELPMITRDGRTLWTSHRFRRVRRADGSAVLHGTARDITLQHQADMEHAALQANYRLLADNAMDIVCLSGPDRALRWVSPSVTEVFGWEVSDLLGHELAEFVHPDDRIESEPNRALLYSPAMPGFPLRNYVIRVLTKDGRQRWVSGRATPFFDQAGQLAGVVSGFHDVDELMASTELASAERAKLRLILDSMLDPHVLLRGMRDEVGRLIDFEVTDANPAANAYFPAYPDGLIGQRFTRFEPSLANSDWFGRLADVVDGDAPLAIDDARVEPHPGEECRYVDVRGVTVEDGISVVWHDNTERHHVASALAESSALYHALAENASDVVAMGNIDGTLRWVSPSVASILGWSPEQLVGRQFDELVHPDDRHQVSAAHDELVTRMAHQYEARFATASGQYHWFSFRVRQITDDEGTVTGRVAAWHDIQAEVHARDELVATQRQLRHQATHDTLTGLSNRRELLVRARAMLDELATAREHVGVLFIDVDRLKQINDAHGHAAGDETLVVLGARIAERIRRSDVLARFGGDEFVVLAPGIRSADEAAKVARAVISAADSPVQFEHEQIVTTLSVGVALASKGDDPSLALRRADNAMYAAKKAGRNQYAFHDGDLAEPS